MPTQSKKSRDWQELTQLSQGKPMVVERVRLPEKDIVIEGSFELPDLARLSADDQIKVLKGLESGDIALDESVDSKAFFEMLLQNTKEGYFSDPIYGGNKDMGAWKMIGFPGAHYDYKEWVSRYGERVPYPPVSFKGRPGWTEK